MNRHWGPIRWSLTSATGSGPAVPAYGTSTTASIDVVAAADPLSTMGQDDADIPRPVAIESDGTEQYRQMTVRERSRLRPQLLERLGWRYMPLWTIEVFTDPSACADRIGGYLGLEKPSPSVRSVGAPGFFLDDDVSTLAVGDLEPEPGQETGYENLDDRFGDELSRGDADERDADAVRRGPPRRRTDRHLIRC